MKGRPKIFIVDDSEMDLEISQMSFRKICKKLQVFSFIDAESFIGYLEQTYSSLNSPALLLLDINMPTMNGFELLEILHNKNWNSFPRVVLSSSVLASDKVRALQLGADAFHEKPFGFMETIELFSSLLQQYIPGISLPNKQTA